MRRLVLTRKTYEKDRTLGTLDVMDGPIRVLRRPCLELPWLNNLPRVSCVAVGIFDLVLEYSPAFKKELWELKGVPGRSEAKIHGSNFPWQLLGCIAPGLKFADLNKDGALDIASSKQALADIHYALGGLTKTTIEIVGDGRELL